MPPPSIRTEARLAGARDQAFQHALVEPLIAPLAFAVNHRTIQADIAEVLPPDTAAILAWTGVREGGLPPVERRVAAG